MNVAAGFSPPWRRVASPTGAPIAGQSPPETSTRRWRWLVVGVLTFGIICRLSQYAARTSLWHDEAFVALNVVHHDLVGFLGPLDFHEPSPPAFLALEQLVASALGYSEYALRLVPLVAGIAALVAFALLAHLVAGARAAWFWSVLLAAASAKLIEQCNVVKHFTLDLLFAVLLTGLAIAAQRGVNRRHLLWAWGGIATTGLWFSYATAFVFAGTSVALLLSIRGWSPPARRAYGIANLAVLASAALLAIPIRAQMTGTVLDFWTRAFPDTTSLSRFLYWFARAGLGLFDFFWQPFGALLLVLVLIGAREWWASERRAALACLCFPVALALLASAVHVWPFGGNHHMVLAAAAVFLLAAEGIEQARRQLAGWRSWAAPALVALLFVPGVMAAAYRIVVPRQRHEIRPVIETVQRRTEPGDTLLVFCAAEFEFYTGRRIYDDHHEPDPANRVWVIGTHAHREPFPNQELLERLGRARPRLLAVEEYGAAAYLFGPEHTSRAPFVRSATQGE